MTEAKNSYELALMKLANAIGETYKYNYNYNFEDDVQKIYKDVIPILTDGIGELLATAKQRDFHTAIDTCGLASKEAIMQVLPYVDSVLFSLKGSTEVSYQVLTKAKLSVVQDNLLLISRRKPVTLRYVLIPGYTAGKESLAELIRLVHSLSGDIEVEVLPYHTMGIAKWDALGWDYPLKDVPEPTKEELTDFRNSLRQAGINLAATEK